VGYNKDPEQFRPLLTLPDPFVKDRAFFRGGGVRPANPPEAEVSVPEFSRLGLSGLCARLHSPGGPERP
jgi:hypothetical protein